MSGVAGGYDDNLDTKLDDVISAVENLDPIGLKDISNTKINPATSDKQINGSQKEKSIFKCRNSKEY